MDTQHQIDNLIELAIVQRAELKQLVEQIPQLREHLTSEIEKTFEAVEPELRQELEEFFARKTEERVDLLRGEVSERVAEMLKSLEMAAAAKYSALMTERARNAELLEQAEQKIAEAAASIPDKVKDIVTDELARFPRAGEIDQLRKEFAEPRGLNPRGKWLAGESYNKLDLVTINGDSYVSNIDGNTEKPSRGAANWTLNAARGNSGGGGGITSLNDLIGAPSAGDIVGSEGSAYVRKTLTAGSGITITEDPTTITIDASGAQELLTATVKNAESVAITKGQVVYLFGATGNMASVKLAYNTSDATSAKTFGVVSSTSIAPNGTGLITCVGVVDGLNLGTFNEGDTVYLGATPGTFTATKPYAPNHLVYVGIVERANAGNGELYVKIQNGYELDEIHDVQINSPRLSGQTLIYDATTSLWKNAQLTAGVGVSISNGASSITISADGGVNYQGTWNASTNTPTLTSSVGTKGFYYVVSVAGTTNLNGVTDWQVGDWAIFNGTAWEKVDTTDQVSSVFGRTGAVVGVSTDYSAVGITNTAIGASNPSTGAFTSLSSSSTTTLNGTTIPASKTLVVTTDKLSALASTSSAELAGVISDETGTGALVFANTPTLVTPNIGAATGTSFNLSGSGTLGTTLVVNGTTDSSSKDTGAIVTEGGLGVEKSATIGVNATIGGTLGVGPSSTLGTVNITTPNLTYGTVYLNGATTGADFMRLKSSGADGVFGIESSVGSAILSGSSANATVLYSVGSNPLQFGTAGSVKGTLTSGGNLLIGTTTDSSNGKLQLATHTTSAGGIGFGTDISLYRVNPNSLKIGLSAANFTLDAGGSGTGGARIVGGGGLTLTSNTGESLYLQSGGLVGITINSSQQVHVNATTASTSSSTGALTVGGGVGVAGNLNIGGELQISSAYPAFKLTDTNSNSDFTILNDNGRLAVYDETNAAYRLTIGATGGVKIGTTPEDVGANNLKVQGTLAVSSSGVSQINGTLLVGAQAASGASLDVQTASGTASTLRLFQQGVSNWVWSVPASTDALVLSQYGTTEAMRFNSSRNALFASTTASTSTSTGALVVSGGVGVAGAIYAGGGITATGTVYSAAALSTAGGLICQNADVTGGYIMLRGFGSQDAGLIFLGQSANNNYINSSATSISTAIANTAVVRAQAEGWRVLTTTASTTTSTGALVVGNGSSGGLGVGGAASIGGPILVGTSSDVYVSRVGTGILDIRSASSPGTAARLDVTGTTSAGVGFRQSGTRDWFISAESSELRVSCLTAASIFAFNSGTPVAMRDTTASTSTSTGALVVSGGVGVAGAAYVGGNATVFGTAGITINNVNGLGNDSILTLAQSGVSNAFIKNTATTGDIAIGDGGGTYLRITKGVGVVSLLNTSASTSTSSGALVVSGGVGVAGKVNAGSFTTGGATTSGVESVNVSTTAVDIAIATSVGALYFVSGYNASGGAQGTWLLMLRGTNITTVSSDNNTGLTVTFSMSSGKLQAATASGTLVTNAFAITRS